MNYQYLYKTNCSRRPIYGDLPPEFRSSRSLAIGAWTVDHLSTVPYETHVLRGDFFSLAEHDGTSVADGTRAVTMSSFSLISNVLSYKTVHGKLN